MLEKVRIVAWREFKHTVLTKAFLIGAVIFPALMWVAVLVLPGLLEQKPAPLAGRLAVLDPDGAFVPALRVEFDAERIARDQDKRQRELRALLERNLPDGLRKILVKELEKFEETIVPEVEVVPADPGQELDALKEEVRRGEYLGLLLLAPELLDPRPETNNYQLYLPAGTTRKHSDIIARSVKAGVVRARVEREGLDLERTRELVAPPQARTVSLTADGGEAEENKFVKLFLPLGFMMLLWMSTMISGQYLLTTTIEEKANKVIEVLLSAVSPMQLMSGKILGQAMVGLLMVAFYASVGVMAAQQFGFAHLLPPQKLFFLLVYFLMAYFMIASLMASVGSAVNELREAQSLMGPVSILFMVPFLAWFFISDHPNSTFATVLSFIPPITPFVMILRVTAIEPVPLWQVAATAVVGFAAVVGMVWMCAKIFRVGVLMYGKPPTPLELWKWMRSS